MAAYDLHIHSGYSSDGELPVAAIVGLCAARGLDAFSLTDHNSVRCVGEAARLARERGIYLIAGSLPELEGHRVYNTSFVYAPDGTCIARHRKIHLFDIDVEGGQRFMESEVLSPGREVTTFDTPWGTMGLCICFDMRFQELCRLMALRGARVIFAPAAFNMTTGPAHWKILFRQRAVDQQCFTVGTSRPGTKAPPMWPGDTPLSATPGAG